MAQIHSQSPNRGLLASAFVIGVAFSGLFDGILLHQILQWHHLLSLVPGDRFRDLRVQVFADGAFHIFMYGIAALGLWLLWRARHALAEAGGGRRFAAGLLLGFGAWNVADVVLFHWVLGIHHIRVDVAQPLPWDIGWLVVLGILPLLAGWAVRRGGDRGGPAPRFTGSTATALIWIAGAASLTGGATDGTAVLFRPGLSPAQIMAAVAAADGRVVWVDGSGELLVIKLPAHGNAWQLYRYGAIMVGGAGPAGCLAWSVSRST
jgi:uncharacterized membrane protein